MEKIKISELSIGDWVNQKMNDGAYQVQWIDREMVGLIKHTGTEEDGSIRLTAVLLWFIEPIPLTAEILENNGFEKGEIYEGNSSIVFTNGNISISWFNGARWKRLRIYNALGDTELCSAIVRNVHQLQHALRLAGVEKEVVL